jgi:hypothetical protein
MKSFSFLALIVFPFSLVLAEVPLQPLAGKGELIFADSFDRKEVGEWQNVIPTFSIQDGMLRGEQTRADHGAVGRIARPMKDVIVEFKFQLDGSTGFNAVFDDKTYRGSHAGHICRVAFAPKQLRLGDDKEGIMRNDIFEQRKDPARKAAADQSIADRNSVTAASFEPGKWYSVVIEIIGDQMRVSVDGAPRAYLKSSGIGHPTKSSFHFTVPGKGVLFDEVKIWKAG